MPKLLGKTGYETICHNESKLKQVYIYTCTYLPFMTKNLFCSAEKHKALRKALVWNVFNFISSWNHQKTWLSNSSGEIEVKHVPDQWFPQCFMLSAELPNVLAHFRLMFLLPPWSHQKMYGFLIFPGGDIKWKIGLTRVGVERWPKFNLLGNPLSANPHNDQTHSNNSSAKADKLFECFWPICGVGA